MQLFNLSDERGLTLFTMRDEITQPVCYLENSPRRAIYSTEASWEQTPLTNALLQITCFARKTLLAKRF